MTKPRIALAIPRLGAPAPVRKSPMKPHQIQMMLDAVIESLKESPKSCRTIAEICEFNRTTMQKYLAEWRLGGLVHSIKPKGQRLADAVMWHPGPGGHLEPELERPKAGEIPKSRTVTAWPPVTCKKQHIWSAVMG